MALFNVYSELVVGCHSVIDIPEAETEDQAREILDKKVGYGEYEQYLLDNPEIIGIDMVCIEGKEDES